MSVIIRLQNLPWSANALDIRQFFKGLSIPEGGVHIVGGENGDAFIAFSTDEDARQAMMRDREKLNEVQVRLLLSSRAEMQKVIETARQQSMLALQKAGAILAPKIINTPLPTPQPPVITSNSLQNILSNQLGAAPSFLAYQQQAGITLVEKLPEKIIEKPADAPASTSRRDSRESARDRRRSSSRERRRSRSRDRNERNERNDRGVSRRRGGGRERSQSRSREHDWKDGGRGGRNTSRRSSRERMRDRSRERGDRNDRERSRNNYSSSNRNGSKTEKDNFGNRRSAKDNFDSKSSNVFRGGSTESTDNTKNKAPVISPWSIPPVNSYQTNFSLDNSARNSPNPLPNINPGGGANLTNLFNSVNVARNVPLPTVITPNAYTTVSTKAVEIPAAPTIANTAAATIIPAFQNYTSSSAITNNYSVNLLGGSSSNSSDSIKPFALQNPYTAAIRASNMNSNSQDSNASATTNTLASNQPQQSSVMFPGFFQDNKSDGSLQQQQTNAALPPAQMQQEPIAFASTNPYAQMYPNLFAQAATMGVTPKINMQSQMVSEQEPPKRVEGMDNSTESCTIKINNMCGSTTYSDLRKFFNGLFVPHNGIKMVNDKHGLRIGVAYIQFSRVSSVQKALVRNNTMLKTKRVTVEMVSDDEFERVEDSFRPSQRFERNDRNNRNNDSDGWRGGDSNNGDDSSNISEVRVNPFNLDRKPSQNHRHQQQQQQQEPFSVLYIEEIPALTTEQDIMKMFSSFSIYDILLIASPENRREFIAHVKFSRDEEAKAAFEDKSRHMIGYRKVRVRIGRAGEMEKAKEKLRLANEQLRKEEQALAAEEAKEAAEIEEKERKKAVGASTIVIDHDDDEDALMINMQGNIGDDFKRDLRQPNIPSIFDLSNSNKRSEGPSDPRLRRQQGGPPQNRFEGQQDQSNQSSNNNSNDFISHMMEPNFNNNPNDNANFNDIPHQLNAIENSFIIMKNCDYNTRINEVAELFMSSNLRLKHIEPLRNERRMPTGEFIVEFRDPRDAEMATNEFNNTQFRLRNLRVRPIAPQQIADILGKPFLNYYPGGGRNGPQPPHMHGGGGGGGPFEFFGRGGGNMGGGPPGNMMNFRGGPNMRFGGNMSMRGGGGRGGGMPPYGMSMRGMHGGRGGGMMGMGRGGGMMGFNFSPNNQSWNRDNQNYVSDNEESNDNMEDNTEMDAASDSGDVDKPNDDSNGGDDNAGDDNGDDDNGDDDNGGDDNGGDDNGGDDNGGDDNGGDDNGGDDNGGDDNDVDNDNEMSNDNDVSNVNDSQDDTGEAENKSGGIPEKFNRPGCVVTMENLPFKADLQDILRFFGDFKLIPDDIIRRFNDDGSPTGDARVAFATPILARAAFDARKRKYIFNRAIYLSIL